MYVYTYTAAYWSVAVFTWKSSSWFKNIFFIYFFSCYFCYYFHFLSFRVLYIPWSVPPYLVFPFPSLYSHRLSYSIFNCFILRLMFMYLQLTVYFCVLSWVPLLYALRSLKGQSGCELQLQVSWDMMPCYWVSSSRRFDVSWCLHLIWSWRCRKYHPSKRREPLIPWDGVISESSATPLWESETWHRHYFETSVGSGRRQLWRIVQ